MAWTVPVPSARVGLFCSWALEHPWSRGPRRGAAAGGHLALLPPEKASGGAPETETDVGDEDPAWTGGYNAAREEIGGLEGPATENIKIIQRKKC